MDMDNTSEMDKFVFVSDRSQKVIFRNHFSDTLKVISGVPQCSHLGAILFNIFINNLPSVTSHSTVLMYVDDVKLFSRIPTIIDNALYKKSY